MTLRCHFSAASAPQLGATMVEFAIVAVLFFSLLLGIMDFGRLLFTWNAAAEATRWGARIAVVCDKPTPDQVRTRMKRILPHSPMPTS
jgi:Flp pilus assembly protein TadG